MTLSDARRGITPEEAAERVLPVDDWQRAVARDDTLPKAAFRVALAYGKNAGWGRALTGPDGGYELRGPMRPVWPSQAELCAATALGSGAVSAAQERLRMRGHLTSCDVPAYIAAGWEELKKTSRVNVYALTKGGAPGDAAKEAEKAARRRAASAKALHKKNHANRGLLDPACVLCRAEGLR